MNLFIFSTSYITRLFVHELRYLIKEKINKIVVLKENHLPEEFHMDKYGVVLCNNISEALNNCDISIILNNGKLPDENLNRIFQYCHKSNKKIVSINLMDDYLKLDSKYSTGYEMNIPKILNIGIGDAMSTYKMELSLNRLFCDTNVKIYQSFSSFTKNILKTIEDHKIINENFIFRHYQQFSEKYDVNITSINFENIYSMIENIDSISNFKPDYLIININGRSIDRATIENLFKYKNGISPFWVQSKYIDINRDDQNYRHIYCHSLDGNYFWENRANLTTLEHDIMVCLGFPESICII